MNVHFSLFKIILALLFLVMFSRCTSSDTITVYVSPKMNTSGDGSLSHPFGSIPEALSAVRSERQLGNTAPAIIYLREGRHQLNETLVLRIEDGLAGTSTSKISTQYGAGEDSEIAMLTFAAYSEETPIVSAGKPIDGWELLDTEMYGLATHAVGKIWVADLPEDIDKFYTLYDSEGRLNRARDKGFMPTKPGDKRTLYFPKGALRNWDNLTDVEINIRPSKAWMINMLPLEFVDEANAMAKVSVTSTYTLSPLPTWVHTKDGCSAWIENTFEGLDEPGEWVVDFKSRKIYLWPLHPLSNGAPHDILAPTTSELIRVEGEIDYDGLIDRPVRGIAFSGLTFTHADRWAWTRDETRLGWGMQHDWDMFDRPTAMLRFRGAEECEISNCKFINSGGSGVRFDLHAQRNRVEGCEFAHLGEAGIILAGYGPGLKDVNHHNDIINNHIHHFSEITWHSPGIWAWQSGRNYMAHNYVHHSGYAAVLITNRIEPDRTLDGEGGRTVRQSEIPENVKTNTRETYENWKVREKYNHARHNLFENNEITHAVQKLSDGNAIYISGAGTGNIIRYNYIHDNLEHSFPAAIRCDDDQHETTIYGNVLYHNYGFSAGIASKGVNDIINNFIVEPLIVPRWGYVSFEWVSVKGAKVQHNIIIPHKDGGRAHSERPIARTEDGDPLLVETNMDSNLYYHPANLDWMDEHLAKMRAVGNEKASLVADPMFVDPAGGDFGFRVGSPAIGLGIEALDVSEMGMIE